MVRDPHKILFCITSSVSVVHFKGQLRYLEHQGWRISLTASPDVPSQLEEFGKAEGIVAYPFPLDRDIRLSADAWAFFGAVKLFLRERPALSNVGTPKAGLIMGLAAAITRVPIRIYTLHGLRCETATGSRRRVLEIAERLAMSAAHTIVCVSPSLRDQVLRLGLTKADKLVVNGTGSFNGVSLPPEMDIQRTCSAHRHVIGFVGRLVRDKGVEDLVTAFEQVAQEIPDAQLLLIGPTDASDPISTATTAAMAADIRITLVGEVNDVSPFYRQMGVLALPSFREGLPSVLLEAAAYGLPTVATSATGTRDGFVPGETGWEVSAGHPEEIADALLECLGNPDEADARGKAGRAWVTENFSREIVWDRWNRFYSQAAQERARARDARRRGRSDPR